MPEEPLPIRAVVFDLDGTLLDTLADIGNASNQVLTELGLPTHPLEDYQRFVGDGVQVLMQRVLPADQSRGELHAQAVSRFVHVYEQHWNKETRPYPGIRTLLTQLTEDGLPMAVLSNKPQRFTELCVGQLLGDWKFFPVLGQREGVPRKPDPAAALEIAQAWGVLPAECAYLGDTSVDMQTAQRAGMVSIGVAWGFRTVTELRAHGASHILHHPCDLLGLLRPAGR